MFSRTLKIAAAAALISFINFAHAGEEPTSGAGGMSNSEFLHQAESGVFEVSPATGLVVESSEYRGAGGLKQATVAVPLGVQVEYGFAPMLAADFHLIYATASSSYTCDAGYTCKGSPRQRGLYDPGMDLKARFAVGPGTLRAGTSLNVPIEKSKIDASNDSNFATGGTTLTPFVAYELPVGPGYLGFRVSYDAYRSERKQTDDNVTPSEQTFKGGAALAIAGFYEANVKKITYGGALEYTMTDESKQKLADGSWASAKNQRNSLSGQFYIPIHFTPAITLFPSVIYATTHYSNSSYSVSTSNSVSFMVAGRFAF